MTSGTKSSRPTKSVKSSPEASGWKLSPPPSFPHTFSQLYPTVKISVTPTQSKSASAAGQTLTYEGPSIFAQSFIEQLGFVRPQGEKSDLQRSSIEHAMEAYEQYQINHRNALARQHAITVRDREFKKNYTLVVDEIMVPLNSVGQYTFDSDIIVKAQPRKVNTPTPTSDPALKAAREEKKKLRREARVAKVKAANTITAAKTSAKPKIAEIRVSKIQQGVSYKDALVKEQAKHVPVVAKVKGLQPLAKAEGVTAKQVAQRVAHAERSHLPAAAEVENGEWKMVTREKGYVNTSTTRTLTEKPGSPTVTKTVDRIKLK